LTTNASTDKTRIQRAIHSLCRSFPGPTTVCVLLLMLLAAAPIRARIDDTSAQQRVILGNERALTLFPETLNGKRLGLVINHTSLLPDRTPVLEAFLKNGIEVRAIFSPEHGFTGQQEGGLTVEDSRFSDIPVYSLYGKTKKPTPGQMKNIDAFVYDIQDVGTRFYTYITTLMYVLEAAGKANKSVYVLDRPNPAGGILVEGPILKEKYTSFIGACPVRIDIRRARQNDAGRRMGPPERGPSRHHNGKLAPVFFLGRYGPLLDPHFTQHPHPRDNFGLSGNWIARRAPSQPGSRHIPSVPPARNSLARH